MPANPRARSSTSSTSSSSILHRISSNTPAPLNCHQQQQQQNHRQYRQLFSPATGADRRIVDAEAAAGYHTHEVGPEQVCSAVVQEVRAPLDTVWSVVRRFDNPQAYKHFVKSCDVVDGDGVAVGTLRRVHVVSGLPAATSMERLEILDDERHVFSFSVVGGEHRLSNYRSITTLHRLADQEEEMTVVVESYVVDRPPGNTNEETCVFVDTIVRCNLQSLSHIAENLARRPKEINNNDSSSSSSAPNLN